LMCVSKACSGAPARLGRQEGEARAQRFSVVHVAFAKKEAALRERTEAAEAAAERHRQVSGPDSKGGPGQKILCVSSCGRPGGAACSRAACSSAPETLCRLLPCCRHTRMAYHAM